MSGGPPLPARRRTAAPSPKGVLSGGDERLFGYLPEEVVRNLRRPGSESALLWEAFYPFAHSGLPLRAFLATRPQWGSQVAPERDDLLFPFFWGLDVDGRPMPGLAEAAQVIAGRDDRLEVDLFLRGRTCLIAVEAKVDAEPGRCGRYEAGRCPEVQALEGTCRYWEKGAAFNDSLAFGDRPIRDQVDRPPCARHYQLARTLLMVEYLGRTEGLEPYLCLLLPKSRWPAQREGWQDFAERVRDEGQWRRLRVIAWEDLAALPRPHR